MKCYNHPNIDAVGSCVDCGKALCQECAGNFKPVLCAECANSRTKKEISQCIFSFVISIGIFIIMYIINNYSSFMNDNVTSLFIFSCIPWGWTLISSITSKFSLVLPVWVWIIVYVIKFFLAMLIGIPAFIIKICILIFKLIRSIKMKNYVNTVNKSLSVEQNTDINE